jgi:pimeloyl-ACP methyl ester carboxylesterase
MMPGESDLFENSVPLIHAIRQSAPLPDVPIVVLSATTGTSPDIRERYTGVHADLVASVARGKHIVLPETGHAINEERPEAIAEAIDQVLDEIEASSSVRQGAGGQITA